MGHNTCKSMGRVLCVVRRYKGHSSRKHIFAPVGCFIATRPLILLINYHQAADSTKKYNIDMFSSEFNETNLIMFNYGPYTKHSSI